jgi:hypothetical protein
VASSIRSGGGAMACPRPAEAWIWFWCGLGNGERGDGVETRERGRPTWHVPLPPLRQATINWLLHQNRLARNLICSQNSDMKGFDSLIFDLSQYNFDQ